jgi:N-terminal domain on NACHT_NTPase and P-loop NTPases
MAEALTVVGAIASTIQLVDFTTKVFDRVNTYLRSIDEAPEMLRHIGLQLLFFIQALRLVQSHVDHGHFNPEASSMLKMVIDECSSQMILLDDIVTNLTPVEGDSKMTRSRKAFESLKQEKTLGKVVSRLSDYTEKLLLFQNAVTSGSMMTNTNFILKKWENSAHLQTTTNATNGGGVLVGSRDTRTENTPRCVLSEPLAYYSKQNKNRQFSYFMGLSRFGLFWAFQIGLGISWGNNGFSITPSLHLQQLVKNTSPGFQLFYRSHLYQSNFQSACDELLELFRSGTVSPWDVFPDGLTWIEVC